MYILESRSNVANFAFRCAAHRSLSYFLILFYVLRGPNPYILVSKAGPIVVQQLCGVPWSRVKGQLILKCLFDVFNSSKKQMKTIWVEVKFIYSEKATNFWEIYTVDLTVTMCIGQIYGGDFAKICGLLRIYEL